MLTLTIAAAALLVVNAKTPDSITVIQQWQVHQPVSPGQLADSVYETARDIGITSMQSYVGWAQLEPEEGQTSYSVYDPVVEKLRKHNLKWLPFLIANPPVATPKWFREAKGVDFVCLEHGESTPIQSIWSPSIRAGVRRFFEVFRAHYEPGVIEALNLGISGNWGESIMPVGGGFGMGDDHSHGGWWCGDQCARADFATWARNKYKTLDALNSAWKTGYTSLDDVRPYLPAQARSRRAVVDLADWYMESMNEYSEFWVKTAREFYPDTPIYLCTGGSGQPAHGADFAAQAKLCAPYGAGIRITNQADDAARNFADTRMVASACRLYGSYFTTEPAGDNSPKGVAGRIFDLVSGGGVGVYFKGLVERDNTAGLYATRFKENAKYMVRNVPSLPVAALWPNSSATLDQKVCGGFLARATELRDVLDFEFIDENVFRDDLLKRFSAVVILAGDTLEARTLAKLRAWVEAGGVLIVPAESLPLRTVEDEPADWVSRPSGMTSDEAKSALESNSMDLIGRSTKPLGKGYVFTWPGGMTAYPRAINAAVHAKATDMPWKKRIAEPIDTAFDGVLACRVGEDIYYLNNTDQAVKKSTADGKETEIAPRTMAKVRHPTHSIAPRGRL